MTNLAQSICSTTGIRAAEATDTTDHNTTANSSDMNATLNESPSQQNSTLIIFIIRTLIIGSLLAISSYDQEFAQFYMGTENFPHLTSVISNLSKSHELRPGTFSVSSVDKAERGNEAVDRLRSEMLRLRDDGNELFKSPNMFVVTNESLRNQRHYFHHTPTIIDKKYDKSNEVDQHLGDFDTNNYDDFFSTHDDNEWSTTRDMDSLDGGISFPLDGSASTSSILSWYFDFNYLRNNFHDPEINTAKVLIYLHINVNEKLLQFPGGNLISVELSKDSNPVSYFTAVISSYHIW